MRLQTGCHQCGDARGEVLAARARLVPLQFPQVCAGQFGAEEGLLLPTQQREEQREEMFAANNAATQPRINEASCRHALGVFRATHVQQIH